MDLKERLLNTSEVTKELNLSVRQVNYLVKKGELTPIKQFHKYNIFDKIDVLKYKKQRES